MASTTTIAPTYHSVRRRRTLARVMVLPRAARIRQRERLDLIVVRAAVEAAHAVVERVAGSQHQDRRLHVALPQPDQNRQTVAPWKHDVEHNRVEPLGGRAKERALPRRFDGHTVALALEPLAQRLGDLLFVLDNE